MDDFNKATALILEQLYQAFPRRINIDAAELEAGADRNSIRNYIDTLIFLESEGFIRYGPAITNEIFTSVVLTNKGLAVLNSVPNVLNEKSTFGQKLSHALKEGSKETIKTLVHEIISAAVSGYIKASGG